MKDTHSGDAGGTEDRTDATSPDRVDRIAAEYRATDRPFARVTVVRREPPVSANVGDSAIVTADGELIGWIGGAGCAQSVAKKEARKALETGEPVLVGLAPDPDDVDRPGMVAYPMTCHSGGTLELFVEPVTPTPRVVVVGDSEISRALVRLAGEASFDVTVVGGPGADAEAIAGADDVIPVDDAEAVTRALDTAIAVVIASVGEYDDAGLAAVLGADVPYVGLVASVPRRDELVGDVAEELGIDSASVTERVRTPAGLDIGARTPGEIAVSVLAELIAVRRGAIDTGAGIESDVSAPEPGPQRSHADGGTTHCHDDGSATASDADEDSPAPAETPVDPVCGMDVVGEAAATVTYRGETYHFCGTGCAEAFEDDPDRYLDGEVIADG